MSCVQCGKRIRKRSFSQSEINFLKLFFIKQDGNKEDILWTVVSKMIHDGESPDADGEMYLATERLTV